MWIGIFSVLSLKLNVIDLWPHLDWYDAEDVCYCDTGRQTKSKCDGEKIKKEEKGSNLWLWPWIISDSAEAAFVRADANNQPVCVSMSLLDSGWWKETLNCVVLLKWHDIIRDWRRGFSVYSQNQSKLPDGKKNKINLLSECVRTSALKRDGVRWDYYWR